MAALWATSFLPTIPGVTWLRPANMLSELFAVNFGWTGALGVAFGNSLSDLMRGQFWLQCRLLAALLVLEFSQVRAKSNAVEARVFAQTATDLPIPRIERSLLAVAVVLTILVVVVRLAQALIG